MNKSSQSQRRDHARYLHITPKMHPARYNNNYRESKLTIT
jgi:hypothetical protein